MSTMEGGREYKADGRRTRSGSYLRGARQRPAVGDAGTGVRVRVWVWGRMRQRGIKRVQAVDVGVGSGQAR